MMSAADRPQRAQTGVPSVESVTGGRALPYKCPDAYLPVRPLVRPGGVIASRLGTARLADADGPDAAVVLVEHVAADPADAV